MGWIDEAGEHAGYAVPEFSDGQRGNGTSGGNIPHDRIVVSTEYDDADRAWHITRPAAEVIGWRIMCDCSETYDASAAKPVGELLIRVPSIEQEDLNAGRVYAEDGEVAYRSDADDFYEMAYDRWRREHVDVLESLARIRDARGRVASAERELAEAVHAARKAGQSWESIGRAAGITRQTAHQRWAQGENG